MVIIKEGKPFRVRRGKLVPIPEKWYRQIPGNKTRRHRPSQALHKHRKLIKHIGNRGRRYADRYLPILPPLHQCLEDYQHA